MNLFIVMYAGIGSYARSGKINAIINIS